MIYIILIVSITLGIIIFKRLKVLVGREADELNRLDNETR